MCPVIPAKPRRRSARLEAALVADRQVTPPSEPPEDPLRTQKQLIPNKTASRPSPNGRPKAASGCTGAGPGHGRNAIQPTGARPVPGDLPSPRCPTETRVATVRRSLGRGAAATSGPAPSPERRERARPTPPAGIAGGSLCVPPRHQRRSQPAPHGAATDRNTFVPDSRHPRNSARYWSGRQRSGAVDWDRQVLVQKRR